MFFDCILVKCMWVLIFTENMYCQDWILWVIHAKYFIRCLMVIGPMVIRLPYLDVKCFFAKFGYPGKDTF